MRMRGRSGLTALFAAVLVLSLLPHHATAQSYPNRTITLIVPFGLGGLTDIPARILAAVLQEKVGVPVVVENKTGGSGVVGATHVLRSEPDGYTLHVNANADSQNLHYMSVPYSAADDFAMIGQIVEGPSSVLIVNSALPYRSVADLVADAKANPGKLSFGTSGPASSPIVMLTQLNLAAGTKIQDVPYRGAGLAAAGVAAGDIQGVFAASSSAKPLIQDGRVRALGIVGPRREPEWPDVPTMAEIGYPSLAIGGFVGLAAPGKTPKPVIAYLNAKLNEALADDGFRRRVEPLGMIPVTKDNTPARYEAFLRAQIAEQGKIAALVKAAATPEAK